MVSLSARYRLFRDKFLSKMMYVFQTDRPVTPEDRYKILLQKIEASNMAWKICDT